MSVSDLLVEDFMTTDVFTVSPEEPLVLTGYMMDWKSIRHVPVEDGRGRLVGLLSSLDVISHLTRRFVDDADDIDTDVTVGELMQGDPLIVSPRATIQEAIEMMRRDGVECLPVVEDGQLVGIVSEHDFVQLVARLLESLPPYLRKPPGKGNE
jgi:CBS domain-containing protein